MSGSQSELANARVVEFPLRGEWRAINTPGSRIPSHGTDILGQRYAYDFIRLDRKGRYSSANIFRLLLLGVPSRDCFGWGDEIYAPLDGEVMVARDGQAERRRVHPLRELILVLRTAATFRATPEAVGRVMGNHVITRSGDVFAAFAHLATGTVAVRVGDYVRAGDVIGRVGHTGNSTAPHLHFQLMDSMDPQVARGIPCAFRRYEVDRGGRWVEVADGMPTSTDRIRFVSESDGSQPIRST